MIESTKGTSAEDPPSSIHRWPSEAGSTHVEKKGGRPCAGCQKGSPGHPGIQLRALVTNGDLRLKIDTAKDNVVLIEELTKRAISVCPRDE